MEIDSKVHVVIVEEGISVLILSHTEWIRKKGNSVQRTNAVAVRLRPTSAMQVRMIRHSLALFSRCSSGERQTRQVDHYVRLHWDRDGEVKKEIMKSDRTLPLVSCITMEAYLRKVMRRLLVCRLGSRGSSGLFITARQMQKYNQP